MENPSVDYSQRHFSRVSPNIAVCDTDSLLTALRYLYEPVTDKLPLGKIIPWMGSTHMPMDRVPFQVCLVDLKSYTGRYFSRDQTGHWSCYSFPAKVRAYYYTPVYKIDSNFSNSFIGKSLQKGSGTLDVARVRVPHYQRIIEANQRNLGFSTNTGMCSTWANNHVPAGRYSRKRISAEQMRSMLHDYSSAQTYDPVQYPAARRTNKHQQQLIFQTGAFTLPGASNPFDMVGRAHQLAESHRRWISGLDQGELHQLSTQERVKNYKRSESHTRINRRSRYQLQTEHESRRRGKDTNRIQKKLVQAFRENGFANNHATVRRYQDAGATGGITTLNFVYKAGPCKAARTVVQFDNDYDDFYRKVNQFGERAFAGHLYLTPKDPINVKMSSEIPLLFEGSQITEKPIVGAYVIGDVLKCGYILDGRANVNPFYPQPGYKTLYSYLDGRDESQGGLSVCSCRFGVAGMLTNAVRGEETDSGPSPNSIYASAGQRATTQRTGTFTLKNFNSEFVAMGEFLILDFPTPAEAKEMTSPSHRLHPSVSKSSRHGEWGIQMVAVTQRQWIHRHERGGKEVPGMVWSSLLIGRSLRSASAYKPVVIQLY